MTNLILKDEYSVRADKGTAYPLAVEHGGVTGVLALTFTEPTHIYAHTLGEINNDYTVLSYRGTEFLVSLHAFERNGQWIAEGRVHATRRDNWSDATATQTRKLAEAIVATIEAHKDTAEVIAARKAGTLYNAEIARDSAARKVRELNTQLQEARAELSAATKLVQDATAL